MIMDPGEDNIKITNTGITPGVNGAADIYSCGTISSAHSFTDIWMGVTATWDSDTNYAEICFILFPDGNSADCRYANLEMKFIPWINISTNEVYIGGGGLGYSGPGSYLNDMRFVQSESLFTYAKINTLVGHSRAL